MKFKIGTFLLIAFSIGCTKEFTLSKIDPTIIANIKSILLDDSYDLYVREVFKSEEENAKSVKTRVNSNDKSLILIEIEYLLISYSQNNAIYISTMPDMHQQYYDKFSKELLDDKMINIYDFKTFSFGKLEGNTKIKYIDKKDKFSDTWNVVIGAKKESIILESITERKNGEFEREIPLIEALKSEIIFKKLDGYKIVYLNPFIKGQNEIIEYKQDKLYFLKNGNNYQMYFFFTKEINKYGARYPTIIFWDDRIKYKPDPLF